MHNVLITGGAGYIGSHAARLFAEKGFGVVVFDNLFRGYQQSVEIIKKFGQVEFVKGDILNKEDLESVFSMRKFDEVLHFAGLCLVYESVEKPELYSQNNVQGTMNLLEAMQAAGVNKLIFSSTGAVYGDPERLPVKEVDQLKPVNPYGESKASAETLIEWQRRAHGLKYVIFRYFNVCGSDSSGEIGDSKKPSELLMQNAVRGAMGLQDFVLTCPNVDTPDGTPIRDYIDVEDLAQAHLLALQYLDNGNISETMNLGNGAGYSVKEIVSEVEKVFGKKIKTTQSDKPRAGENPKIFADITLVKTLLGWEPRKSLRDSILSLKKWYEKFPNGYEY